MQDKEHMVEKEKILAIGAHPDDVEQFAGGTLYLLAQKGHEVVIAAITAGECGSKTLPPAEIVAVRREESEKAAKLLGATFINLGLVDGSINYDLENMRKVVGLIRDVNPTIIFTHPTIDYMADHAHTGQLVLWATPEAMHANFQAPTKAPSIGKQPYVYHTDPQSLVGPDGQIARVNTIVDITDSVEKKLEAFATHKSQIGFLPTTGMDSVEKTRRWAVTRGEQVRVLYGEGFCQELLAEYPRNNILVELLPGKAYTL